MINNSNKQLGFTLIEMIVSLALFSVVITVSVGALLVLIASNEQLQAEQSVMTNLSFALDSMTREIRTGTDYFCESKVNLTGQHAGSIDIMFDNNTDLDTEIADKTRDCPPGRGNDRFQGVAFNEGGGSITGTGGRILYFYDADEKKIFRRVGSGVAQSIISSAISISDAEFYVTGSAPLTRKDESNPANQISNPEDNNQATVTIFIQAKEKDTDKTYELQTTITQRTLDI